MRTTPTAAMEILLDMPPLHLIVKAEALKAGLRLKLKQEMGPTRKGHSSILEQTVSHPILEMATDRIGKTYCFAKPFEVITPSRDDWSSKDYEERMEGLVVYTDGSKSANTTGIGVWSAGRNGLRESSGLGRHASILQTEIYAIMHAAHVLLERNSTGRRIFIVTDSKPALATLGSCEITSRLVLECLRALQELAVENTVKLVWVPGHSHIKGNQEADRLAKNALNVPFIGPEPACGITREAINQELNTMLKQNHCDYWERITGQETAKAFLGEPSSSRTNNLLTYNRKNLRQITGIITGHCHLKKHLHNLGHARDPTCRGCYEEDETVLHVLCHCEAFNGTRKSTLGAEKLTLEEVRKSSIKEILNFLSKTGLFEEM